MMRGKLKRLGAIGMFALGGIITACTGEKDPEPTFDCANLSNLQIELVRTQKLTGCDASDGLIEVAATGAEGETTFRINDDASQANGLFENLDQGTFTVSVEDENGCISETQVVLTVENSDLAIANVNSTNSGCESSNADLTVTASGSGTLMYKLNNGAFQESSEFFNLQAGQYTVTVRDDICETTSSHRIRSGVSYNTQISSILSTNCALSGCHNGSTSLPNWTVLSTVQSNASNIRSRTQSGSMPPASSGRTLTQEEKDLIACWVDDGALNN